MKKLVDISVWILFVVGCIMLIIGILALFTRPIVTQPGLGVRVISAAQFWGVGVFSIFLSVVAAWFRSRIG